MFMDKDTLESLDFQYILNKIETLTPYGIKEKNRARAFKIGEEDELRKQLNILSSYLPYIQDYEIKRELNQIFIHMKDLKSSINRAEEGSTLTKVELFEIKNLLMLIRQLEDLIERRHIPIYEETEIKSIEEIERLLDPENTGATTFYIYDSYSQTLKNIREESIKINREIKLELNNLKEELKEELHINPRPDNSIQISKEDKNLIEKFKEHPKLIYVSETYMNVKFNIRPTENITLLESQLILLKDQEEKEKLIIRKDLSKKIGKRKKDILRNMDNIGRLDFIIAKAKFALDIGGVKPQILKEHRIKIIEGRHPIVEERLNKHSLGFTPISIELKTGATCITGANMGGKTISLKLVGLISAMAQYGLYVPAEFMELGLSHYIKTSIGDMQSTHSGLSTFGSEIKVVKEAIERAEERGLILIDELARGTNPEEGYAISKAIVTYLMEKQAIALLTTHYDNVTDIEGVAHLQVVGLSKIDYKILQEELQMHNQMDIINKYMDYRLEKVGHHKEVPKDAINIAKIMGLNPEIIGIAEKLVRKD